ncbi:DEAD/DEAH box helicase [Salegentibacter sediminis]|uniref:DEAD/DEAH box helicase n=1 Tax=Salegentibacter sediminis TaxID=1930251 RepID=UPI0009BFE2A2|nr:DEAD/DEAH box helicase [Salegentibacter sediminis]
MQKTKKNHQEILTKLGISELNPMQKKAHKVITEQKDTVLLSPTGTGKTLGFLLPLLELLDPDLDQVQAIILVPSRELAIQIEQVTREIGSGFKTNAVYGGRAFAKDKIELNHPPAILIGTPGRIADHIRRKTFAVEEIRTLILDEFDKSLEVGFTAEMSEIIGSLTQLEKRILTSATQGIEIPGFTGVKEPKILNYLEGGRPPLEIKTVSVPGRNKLPGLKKLINQNPSASGIVFCNFKDSIAEVSDYLNGNKISHACFFGGMEQKDRERALIKFRNGSHRIIIATDLAARGIDVPEIDFIIHYQLPFKNEEFIHRNGRTARMHSRGIAYVLHGEKENLPEFIKPNQHKWEEGLSFESTVNTSAEQTTLFISGGRKDKISKADIAGLFLKQGQLEKEELGLIELKQDCAFVAVPTFKAKNLIEILNNTRLKRKKVRISLV